MKKSFKKLTVIFSLCFLAMLMAFAVPSQSHAAKNGTTGTSKITVQTKANWLIPGGESITLGNNKVTISYTSWGKQKTKKIYPTYKVKATATDGSHKISKTMSGSSLKLSLKRNKTYTVTVTYDHIGTWLDYANLRNAKMNGNPYWWVKSTYKVSNCY